MAATVTSTMRTVRLGDMSYDAAQKLFRFQLDPCQVRLLDVTTAGAAVEPILAAPGANKAIYVWAVSLTANANGSPDHSGMLIYADSGGASPVNPVNIRSVRATALSSSSGGSEDGRIEYQLPTNKELDLKNIATAVALAHTLFIKYAIVDVS